MRKTPQLDEAITDLRHLLESILIPLVILKCYGLIDTSWWLVTLPFTIPAGFTVVCIVVWFLWLMSKRRRHGS